MTRAFHTGKLCWWGAWSWREWHWMVTQWLLIVLVGALTAELWREREREKEGRVVLFFPLSLFPSSPLCKVIIQSCISHLLITDLSGPISFRLTYRFIKNERAPNSAASLLFSCWQTINTGEMSHATVSLCASCLYFWQLIYKEILGLRPTTIKMKPVLTVNYIDNGLFLTCEYPHITCLHWFLTRADSMFHYHFIWWSFHKHCFDYKSMHTHWPHWQSVWSGRVVQFRKTQVYND